NIFTTNYDLFLYHIIMKSLDIRRDNREFVAYQDYYWGPSVAAGFKEFVNYQTIPYKHIYYLHGSLFVFNQELKDVKIIRSNREIELIDLIANQIRNSNIPNFVSEGTGEDKRRSISRNEYLRFCSTKLKDSTNSIVVFGNSLGEFDSHILEAIKAKTKDIVFCMYVGDKSKEELNHEKLTFAKNFNKYQKEIHYVDSGSLFTLS